MILSVAERTNALHPVPDTRCGLAYLNNRHYDPTTGVFMSVDPLVTMTGEPYIYGSANPITYSYPSGLVPCHMELAGCTGGQGMEGDKNPGELPCGHTCAPEPPAAPPVVDNGNGKPPTISGEPVEGARSGDVDVVQGLLDVWREEEKTWSTVGTCGGVGVGILGFGAGAEMCSFVSSGGQTGGSLSLYFEVGAIGTQRASWPTFAPDPAMCGECAGYYD